MTGDLIVDYRTQETSAQYGFARTNLGILKKGQVYTLIACGYASQEQLDGKGCLSVIMYNNIIETNVLQLFFESIKPQVKQATFTADTNNTSIQAYSFPSAAKGGPTQNVTLLWYKVVEGEYDFDIYDAYGLNGPGFNILRNQSRGGSVEHWASIGVANDILGLDTTTFEISCIKTNGAWMNTRDALEFNGLEFKPNTPYTICWEAYVSESNGTTSFKVPMENSTMLAGDLTVSEDRLNRWVKYWAVCQHSSRGNITFYVNNRNTFYYLRNAKWVEGDHRYFLNWTGTTQNVLPFTDNFVNLQGLCRNIPYFCGSSLVYKPDGCAQLMSEEFDTNWKSNDQGNWSIVDDDSMGKVAQYERINGTGNYQWSISPTYTTDLTSLNNKTTTIWVIIKNNGNGWLFSQWNGTNTQLPYSVDTPKVELGNGWRLYYEVRNDRVFKDNTVCGFNSLQGTIQFHSCGVCEGDISPLFDLAAWNGFYYKISEEEKIETSKDWVTTSINVTKSPTTNIANTGGTVTLSATATQTKGSVTYKRAIYSNGTHGDWYQTGSFDEAQTIDINSLGTFSKVGGTGSLSERVITFDENKTTTTRSGIYKVSYDGKEAQVTITQSAGIVRYELILSGITIIPASGGSVTIGGTYKTYWNGSSTATSSISVTPTLSATSTPNGWTLSGNKITAPSRGTTVGTILTATGTASYGNASLAYSVQQQANSATYSIPNVFARYTKVVPANGGDSGAPVVSYSQYTTYTSGATNNITSGATITYKQSLVVSPAVRLRQWWLANPAFTVDVKTVGVYDNANSGNCTLTRVAGTNPVSVNGGYITRWQNKGSGTTPNLGGFGVSYTGVTSHTYYCTFVAKIPKGYQLEHNYNPLGTGGSTEWLSSVNGTGDWQNYTAKVSYGTGTVGTVFFFSIKGGSAGTEANPLTVDLAYITVLEEGTSSTGLNTSTGAWTLPNMTTNIDNLCALSTADHRGRVTEIDVTLNGRTVKVFAQPPQAANYVTKVAVAQGTETITYPTIPAKGGTYAPQGEGQYAQTFTFTSGSTSSATPASTYGTLNGGAVYSMTPTGTFTGMAGSQVVVSSKGYTISAATQSNPITRTFTLTWTHSANYTLGGTKTGSYSRSDIKATQALNKVESITAQPQSGYTTNLTYPAGDIPAKGGTKNPEGRGACKYVFSSETVKTSADSEVNSLLAQTVVSRTYSGSATGMSVNSSGIVTGDNRTTVIGARRSISVNASLTLKFTNPSSVGGDTLTSTDTDTIVVYQQANAVTATSITNANSTNQTTTFAVGGQTIDGYYAHLTYTSESTNFDTTVAPGNIWTISGTGFSIAQSSYHNYAVKVTAADRTTVAGAARTATLRYSNSSISANATLTLTQAANEIVSYNYGNWTGTLTVPSGDLPAGAGSKTITWGSIRRTKTPVYSTGDVGTATTEYWTGTAYLTLSGTDYLSLSESNYTNSSSTTTSTLNKTSYNNVIRDRKSYTIYLRQSSATGTVIAQATFYTAANAETSITYGKPTISTLIYSDINAAGTGVSPTLSYTQSRTQNYTSGYTEALPNLTSGATAKWTSTNSVNGGAINASTGVVTANSCGTTYTTRRVVLKANLVITMNGVSSDTKSVDIYQQANYVTKVAFSKTENLTYTQIGAGGGNSSPSTNSDNVITFTFTSGGTTTTIPATTYGAGSMARTYSWPGSSGTFATLNTSTGVVTANSKGATVSGVTTSPVITKTLKYTWTPKSPYPGNTLTINSTTTGTVQQQANSSTATYNFSVSYPTIPAAGGTVNITDNSTYSTTYTSGITIGPVSFAVKPQVSGDDWLTLNSSTRALTATSNANGTTSRSMVVRCYAPDNVSYKSVTVTQLAGLGTFRLIYPNPSNYSSSSPLNISKGTSVLCEFDGVNDAYDDVYIYSPSGTGFNLVQYQSDSNKVFLRNVNGGNNSSYNLLFKRRQDSSDASLWVKSIQSTRVVQLIIDYTIYNKYTFAISTGSNWSSYANIRLDTGEEISVYTNIHAGSSDIPRATSTTNYGVFSVFYQTVSIKVPANATKIVHYDANMLASNTYPNGNTYSTVFTPQSGYSVSGFWRDNRLSLSVLGDNLNITLPASGGQQSSAILNTYVYMGSN